MCFADELRVARSNKTAPYLDFILVKKYYDIIIFCEGKDDNLYYEHIIKAKANGYSYLTIVCHGKTNVIYTENKIMKNHRDKNILYFFVDKDFDECELSSNIYITPTYSIENLYFTDKAINNFLTSEMQIDRSIESEVNDFNNVYNTLRNARDNSLNEILVANAIYSLQKKKSSSCEPENKANLEDIKEYVDIKDKSKEEIIRKIKNIKDMTDDEIKLECERLSQNLIVNIRGKYILAIMKKIYSHIVEELNIRPGRRPYRYINPPPSKRYPISFNPENEKLLRSLSIYAEIPIELSEYIDQKLI